MKIFLVGPPAGGKTVTGQDLAGRYGLDHLSSGDVARVLGNSDPKIAEALKRGEFIPPAQMDSLMLGHLLTTGHQVIDGYPRYFEQLADINTHFNAKECSFVVVSCPEAVIRERHAARGRAESGDIDDRLQRYREFTQPMVKWLERYSRTVWVSTYDNNRADVVRIITDGINRMNGFNAGLPLRKVS